MEDGLAERYARFARFEAAGQSPLYEALAWHVSQSQAALDFLSRLPPDRQQPNLLFAAIRHATGGTVAPSDMTATLNARSDAIAAVMMARTTQTNEPGRCAVLMPVLSRIPGPIALIEVGASAGLCLLPDAYGYAWGQHCLPPPSLPGAAAPTFTCDASDKTPLPFRHPEIAWRAGLDLNPLDLRDAADVAWLESLVWPEHEARLARLRAAIAVAREAPPRVEAGDLMQDLPALIAEAPREATIVVFHTAVLAYVRDQADRDRFADLVQGTGAVWISNEGPRVFPQFAAGLHGRRENMFLLAANGAPLAWTGPHGQAIDWIGPNV